MEKDNNHQQKIHNEEPLIDILLHHSSSSDQDQYINQFLHPSVYSQNQKYQYQTLSSHQPHQHPQQNYKREPMQSESEEFPKNNSSPTKSVFHNLQKHLVVALRNIIQISKNHTANAIGVQMWQIFMTSNKFTKNGLHILFGFCSPDEDDDIQTTFFNNGFGNIIQKYSVLQIQQAQNFLRNTTLNQLKSSNLQQYIEKTRIKRKAQFLQYMISFISELESGPLKKRLSKQASNNFSKNLKKEQFIGRRSPRRFRQ